MKRLNDVFPEWLTGSGIFGALQNFPVPWAGENLATSLDMEYHGNISGDKPISPLVEKIRSGDTLTATEKNAIATAIMAVCGVNWGKQWETLSFQYDPIQNYSMTENMTDDKTVDEYGKTRTRTDNLSHTRTGTETDRPNVTETQTPDLTNSRASQTHGFNSVNPVPTNEDTNHATGTNTNTRTGTDTREYNTTDADTGTQTENDGGRDTRTRNYRLTRSGNIGVTTSQQMIESERALWVWHFFYDAVFPDIDRILTLQIY